MIGVHDSNGTHHNSWPTSHSIDFSLKITRHELDSMQGAIVVALMASVTSYTFIAVGAATWMVLFRGCLVVHSGVLAGAFPQPDGRSILDPAVNMRRKYIAKTRPCFAKGRSEPHQFRNAGKRDSEVLLRHRRRGKGKNGISSPERYTYAARSQGVVAWLHSRSQTQCVFSFRGW